MVTWTAALLALTVVSSPGESVVLEFSKANCQPCRQLQPAVDQLVSEGWIIRSVNVDREPDFAHRWHVTQLPTLIVVQKGREVDRVVGAMPLEKLRERLQRVSSPSNSSGVELAGTIGSRPTAAAGPIVRGQSPASSKTAAAAVAAVASMTKQFNSATTMSDPAGATVRICVDDGNSEAFGTGTIIDTHGNEALVLTCGHLFREGGGRSPMRVDVWMNGEKLTYPATIVHYRADETDIGLIAFAADRPMKSVSLLPQGTQLGERQPVFSYGCDGGADPTRRDTMITKLNRYLGPSNVEIAGAPVQGRSGGGLFDDKGNLIGVCFAADKELDEGLYSGPDVIYQELAQLNLTRLYQPRNELVAVGANSNVANQDSSNIRFASNTSRPAPDEDWQPGNGRSSSSSNVQPANAQVVAIIRQPGQPERTINIQNASPSLLQMINQQGNN
jgi:Trypsin-like peptidase domain/Thioredoxin